MKGARAARPVFGMRAAAANATKPPSVLDMARQDVMAAKKNEARVARGQRRALKAYDKFRRDGRAINKALGTGQTNRRAA